ncbi:MAG: HPP family protein [Acidobacteriota bacterium]
MNNRVDFISTARQWRAVLPNWRTWLLAFRPAPIAVDAKERRRAIIGALLGVVITAGLSRLLSGSSYVGAWLVAPLGASAVLVFAAPASPLAQPWSVVVGNSVSALVGVGCAIWFPDVVVAGSVAVALAITVMFGLRCLHPPGGAVALSAVLVHASQGHFAIGAALVNSLLLVAVGVVYNSLTGRRYPHMQMAPAAQDGVLLGARFKSQDLDAVLARYNQVLDVSRDDLEALLQEAELEGYRRRMGEILCRDVMTRNVVSVEFGDTLQDAWDRMREHRVKALPVVDRSRRIVGILTMADFMRAAQVDGHQGLAAKLRHFILPDGLLQSDKPEVVGQIMTRQVRVTSEDRHAVELMPLFTDAGHHHIPVIDADKRLVGMITQSDFMRALYQVNG